MLLRTAVCSILSFSTNVMAAALYRHTPPFPGKPWWAVAFLAQTGWMYLALIWMKNTE